MRPISELVSLEYAKRRNQALDEAQRRREKLFADDPALSEAYAHVAKTGINYAKLVLAGKLSHEQAKSDSTKRFASIDKDIKKSLERKQQQFDSLTVQYTCTTCKDSGYTQSRHRCRCYADVIESIVHSHPDYAVFRHDRFEHFDETLYPDVQDVGLYGANASPRHQICAILKRCRSWIDTFDATDGKNLLFTGHTGLGKTFMAHAVAFSLLKKGYDIHVTSAPELFDLTSAYAQDRESHQSTYRRLFTVPLLVLDDLGTEKMTESRYAQFLHLLDTRWKNNGSRACKTILVSNSSMNELFEQYSERIASRIAGNFVILKFIGDDIRILNKEDEKK